MLLAEQILLPLLISKKLRKVVFLLVTRFWRFKNDSS